MADFNGDGLMDLVVANRATNNVSVLLNAGDGTFLPAMHTDVGDTPRYVVAADFDGDGDVDVATPDYDGHVVSVLLNDGIGQMSLHAQHPFLRPACIETADLNGDGLPELIVPHWNKASPKPSQSPALVTVLANRGGGDFEPVFPVEIDLQPRGIAVGDLDADGDPDVAISNLAGHNISILINKGGALAPGTTFGVGKEPRYLAIGDLDGDGISDLAIVHKRFNELWIMINDGALGFTVSGVYPTSAGPHSVILADLDGDCDLDVVASNVLWPMAVDIYVNEESSFDGLVSLATQNGPAHVVAGDLDGDGVDDLATANTGNGTVSVYMSDVAQQLCGPCPGDMNADGTVNVQDLVETITAWGPCGEECCELDLDGNGRVGVEELLQIIVGWGDCP